jgi:hypothetical protein
MAFLLAIDFCLSIRIATQMFRNPSLNWTHGRCAISSHDEMLPVDRKHVSGIETAMGELELVDPQRMPGPVSNTNFNVE